MILITLKVLFLHIFISFAKTDLLDDQARILAGQSCPYIDFDGIAHVCSEYGIQGELKKELLTVNALNGESGFPVIDLEKSSNVNTRTGLQQACNPLTFANIDDFYSRFYNLNLIVSKDSWTYFNGMFRQDSVTTDIIPMLENFVASPMRQILTTNQMLYSYTTISVEEQNVVLNNEFQTVVEQYLPTDYDVVKYKKFVEVFGTHVALSCDYGGMLQTDNFVQECNKDTLFQATFENDLCDDMKAYVQNPLNPTRGGSPDYIKSTTVKRERIVGGNPLLSDKKEWAQRISTFEQDPVGIKCEVVPIDRFISDSSKKENLKKYILEYVQAEAADRAQKFQEVRAKQPIPFVFGTIAPGDGFEYGDGVPGNLQGETKVYKMDWSYHAGRRSGDPIFHVDNVTIYNETLILDKNQTKETIYDRTIHICQDSVERWWANSSNKVKEYGFGTYLITCKCGDDRKCGCWISDVILEVGGQAKCPDWNNLCYNTFDPPIVLKEDTVSYVDTGVTNLGCIPKYYTVYYYYVLKQDYTKLWGGWSAIQAFVNCEKLNYVNGGMQCACQLG